MAGQTREHPQGALRGFLPAVDRGARTVLGRAGAIDPLADAAAADSRSGAAAVPPLVRRRRHQPLLQRSGPASCRARRAAGAGGSIQRDRHHAGTELSRTAPRGECVRGDIALAGRGQGRSCRHLHAERGRGGVRHAGLRAHRRDPLGGIRRLRRAQPGFAHRRCAAEAADRRGRRHARSRNPSPPMPPWPRRR